MCNQTVYRCRYTICNVCNVSTSKNLERILSLVFFFFFEISKTKIFGKNLIISREQIKILYLLQNICKSVCTLLKGLHVFSLRLIILFLSFGISYRFIVGGEVEGVVDRIGLAINFDAMD